MTKFSRRKLLGGTALSALTALLPDSVKAWIHGSLPSSGGWAPDQRPFLDSSPINTPLPAAIPYQPIAWSVASLPSAYFGGSFRDYIDIPNLVTAPTVTLSQAQASGQPSAGFAPPPATFPRQMTVSFTGAQTLQGLVPNDNEGMSLIGNDLMSIWILTRDSDTAARTYALGRCDIINSDGMYKPTLQAGVTVIHASDLYGSIMKEYWTAHGAFDHQIAVVMQNNLTNPGAVVPYLFGDGNSSNGLFSVGNVLAIPPGTTIPAGLSVYGPALFNAFMNYGALICDTGGWSIQQTVMFDATRTGTGQHQIALASWTITDSYTSIANDFSKLLPLMVKTGFALDGFQSVLALLSACSPQQQQATMASSTIMVVSRDSDSTTTNVQKVGDGSGMLNTATITSFCSGTTGRVATYNNQINNTTNFISTGSTAPIIYQSGALVTINGIPALLFDGSTNYLRMAGSSTRYPGTSIYLSAVIQLTDLLADYAIFGSDVSGGLSFQINATTGFLQLQTNTGTVIATATSGAISAGSPFLVSAYYVPSGANPRWFFWINGQNVGFGTPTITAAIGNALLGQAGPTSSKFFKGLIGAKTLAQFMPSNPQYSLENGLVSKWGPMGAFTRIHTTVAQDNFVDTDGVNLASHAMITGLGWTNTVGTYFIQSNSAQDNTLSGGIAHATFIPTTLISDATYTLAVTPAAVASAVGMLFRFSNASNYWMAEVVAGSNIAIINKVVAGVSTRMSTVSMTITAGIPYTLVVTYYGDTITFSVNGNAPASVLDIFNMNATGVGIRVSQSNPTPRSALDSLLLTT